MAQEGISEETARLLVRQADREIECTIYELFGKEWDDPGAYEMAFQVPRQGRGEVVEIVKNLLLAKDALKTPEAVASLRLNALAARIKAQAAANPAVYAATLEMEVRGKGILMRGIVGGKAEGRRIEREARQVAGAVPLSCELNSQPVKKRRPRLVEGL
jgi:hypothetical protein